ncbi:hypothetical protein EVAR_74882_1 [Eumeta japonica]|uniref:Uncharacterized protein n=1 Tax=Eumeta variegata TaxID=151549 RepID=A0A4C1Z261_EUMVA|nr:hypothetical protein EVAR_74882_1 [Eumeta japonica]
MTTNTILEGAAQLVIHPLFDPFLEGDSRETPDGSGRCGEGLRQGLGTKHKKILGPLPPLSSAALGSSLLIELVNPPLISIKREGTLDGEKEYQFTAHILSLNKFSIRSTNTLNGCSPEDAPPNTGY